MLNFIRKKRDKIKWVLWVVIVGLAVSMGLLFVSGPTGSAATEEIRYLVKVGDREIGIDEYRTAVNTYLLENPQQAKIANLRRNPQFIDYIVRRLILEQVEMDEAQRIGITTSDEEIRNFISRRFADEKGRFNFQRYQKILGYSNLLPEVYEEHVRKQLTSIKYRDFVCAPATVSDKEIKDQFIAENDKAKIRYVVFSAADHFRAVTPTEEQIQQYYNAHKEEYLMSESRSVQYLFFDAATMAREIQKTIGEPAVRAYIQSHRDSMPPKIRAAHILVKVPENAPQADWDKAKAKADEITAKARAAGADFAALSTEFSDDPGAAKQGGDLGFFDRTTMVTEFTNAAFALKKDQVSDPVKTAFGWHIIKMLDNDDYNNYGVQASMEMAKAQAFDNLRKPAERAKEKLRNGGDMAAVAKEFGAVVRTSQPFNQQHMDYALGSDPDFIDEIFKLKVNELGSLTKTPSGYVVPRLAKIFPEGIRPLKDVYRSVRDAVIDGEAHKLAQAVARDFLAAVRAAGGDFAKVAAEKNLKITESNLFSRLSEIDRELADSPSLKAEVFRMKPNDVGGPVRYAYREIAYQLMERQGPDMNAFPSLQENIRVKMLNEKKTLLYSAVMQNIYSEYKKADKIKVNDKLVKALSGHQE